MIRYNQRTIENDYETSNNKCCIYIIVFLIFAITTTTGILVSVYGSKCDKNQTCTMNTTLPKYGCNTNGSCIVCSNINSRFCSNSNNSTTIIEHVILIGADGLSGLRLKQLNLPYLSQLLNKSTYTFNATSTMPTASATNWAILL